MHVNLPQGRIHYTERGAGHPLVFVHGYLMDGRLWDRLAQTPELQGFRCIMPTWPLGAHTEPMDPAADLSPPGLAAMIAGFIAALELKDAVLIGNDSGTALTQLVAAHHPAAIGGVVLTNGDAFENFPPSFFKALVPLAAVPGGVTALLQPFRAAPVRRSPLGYGLLSKKNLDELTATWVRPALGDARIRRDLRKVTAGLRKTHTLSAAERLRDFDKPALIAWAPGDRLFPEVHARRLADLLPRSELALLAAGRTFSMIDQPAALAGAIAAWALSPAARTPAG